MPRLSRTLAHINWEFKKKQWTLYCEHGALASLAALTIIAPFENEMSSPFIIVQGFLIAFWLGYILLVRGLRPLALALLIEIIITGIALVLAFFGSLKPPVETTLFFLRESAIPTLIFFAMMLSIHLPSPGELSWKAKALYLLVGVIYIWILMGSILSVDPESSLIGFRREMSAYLIVYLSVIHFCSSFRRLRFLALICFGIVISVSIVVLIQWVTYHASYHYGNWAIRRFLVSDQQMILPVGNDPSSPIHVQFPFEHYSSLAAYLVLGLGSVFFAGAMLEHKSSRQWVQWSALIVSVAVIATFYAPALWAMLVLGCIYFALTRPRYLLLMGGLALAAFLLSTDLYRKPSPVELDPPKTLETIWFIDQETTHEANWGSTWELIRQRPTWGIGYNWRNLRHAIQRNEEKNNLPEETIYQNFYIQWTAMVGFVGLILIILFFAMLTWWTMRRWRDVRQQWLQRKAVSAWLGTMVALFILNAFVYVMREQLGMVIWLNLGMMTNFLLQSQPFMRK